MKTPSLPLLCLFFIFALLFLLPAAESKSSKPKLSLDYYKKSCPRFPEIMNQVITAKQTSSPTTAAGVLRVFFHDCMVDGCDGSTLVASNAFNKAERDADINISLPGDAFDLVTRAKTALELECPGVVSCTDILTVSARNLIKMVGGPYYEVPLGRKDGLVSLASRVAGNIAFPNMTITEIIKQFQAKGFSMQEMVALVGAHTIGFAHCSEFGHRIFNFSKRSQVDPTMNPHYAKGLQKLCANYTNDATMAAFNDVMTPGKFDNMYYKNLKMGLGLLATDQAMAEDPRTKPFVELYANNEPAWFHDFARAMEKVGRYGVKTGKDGEVRSRCDQFNAINTKVINS